MGGGKNVSISTSTTGGDSKKKPQSADELKVFPHVVEERQTLKNEIGELQEFVGLKNLGATCYMNSVLQTMVTTPELRDFLLNWKFESKQQHSKNVAYQLQLLFARLQHNATFSHIDPSALMKSFGMGAEAHREQHDCQELIRVLFSVISECAALGGTEDVIKTNFEGKFADFRECLNCGLRSENASAFQDITVGIGATDGKPTLVESLQQYSTPDIIEGAHCEACDSRKGLKKGEELNHLPDILSIQLRRFGYDLMTGRREKNNEDFELPLSVDLSDVVSTVTDAERKLDYELQSVICHRGTAYHGHYYCFVQTAPGKWLKFDDDEVKVPDELEVLEYINPTLWKEKQKEKFEKENEERRKKAQEATTAASTEEGGSSSEPPTTVDATVAATTQDDGMAAMGSDDVFGAGLFDEGTAQAGGGGGGSSAGRNYSFLPKVSGQSYYAVYRRKGIPAVTPVPNQVSEQCSAVLKPELEEMESKKKRLEELAPVAVAAIHHPLAGDNTKYWVDCRLETTLAELADLWVEQYPGLAEVFPKGSYEQTWRLRKFSGGVLGDSYNAKATLKDLGFTLEAPFAHLGVEKGDPPYRTCKDADLVLGLMMYSEEHDQFKKMSEVKGAFSGSSGDGRFTIYQDAKLGELLKKIAGPGALAIEPGQQEGNGDAAWRRVGITLNKAGDPSNPTELLFPTEADLQKSLSEVGITPLDYLYVEPVAPAEASSYESKLASLKAPALIKKANIVTVKYTISVDSATDAEPEEVTIEVDGRQSMRTLKKFLCDLEGVKLQPDNSQLLDGGSAQEMRNLEVVKVKTMALGTGLVTVKLVEGPPLKRDQFYSELYEATGNFIHPVKFLKRFVANGKTTPEEAISLYKEAMVAKARGAVSADGATEEEQKQSREALEFLENTVSSLPENCFRVRMMEPKRKNTLGYPVIKPTIRQCWRDGHSAGDEIRLVVQLLSTDKTHVPEGLTKDSLILHCARWNSEVEDVKGGGALSDKKEYATTKYTTCKTTKENVLELFVKEAIPTENIQFARAKFYQTQSHDGAWKLSWDQFDVPKNQERDIGFNPFKFEHEDFILYRDKREEWKYVSEDAKQGLSKKKKQGAGADGEKKERKLETGIAIHSVWDQEGEGEVAEGDEHEEGDASSSPKNDEKEAVETQEKKLNSDTYQEILHSGLGSTCQICLDDFVDGETEVTVLECHCIFRTSCLANWVKESATCPACGQRIDL